MLFHTCTQPHIDYGLLIWENAIVINLRLIKKNLLKAI